MAGSTHESVTFSPSDLSGAASRTFRARAIHVLKRNRIALAGAAIITIFTVTAILSFILTPYDPYAVNLSERFIPPDLSHLFGTDNLGRDILSRVIVGSRISLYVGILTVGLSMLIGVPAGWCQGIIAAASTLSS